MSLLSLIPDIITNGIGEESKNLQADTAAMAAIKEKDAQGVNFRQQLYDLVTKKDTDLANEKLDILNKMGHDEPMSKSQVAAMMLIGILPTLIGGAIKGKKGLAIGAQAGQVGTLAMTKGINDERAREDALGLTQLKSIEAAQNDNRDIMNKSLLDQANNADSAEQKALDRANATTNAAIRAGGDAATAKSLNNIAKALEIDKKQTEASARGAPLTINGKVYRSNGAVTDKNVERVDEAMPAYKSLLDNLWALKQAANNAQFGGLSRATGDTSEELKLRREMIVDALAAIKRDDNSAGSSILLKRLDKAITAPGNIWDNIVAAIPMVADMNSQIDIQSRIIQPEVDRFLTSNHYEGIPIGHPVTRNGATQYIIGADKDGYLLGTLEDANSVLEASGYPTIGGR